MATDVDGGVDDDGCSRIDHRSLFCSTGCRVEGRGTSVTTVQGRQGSASDDDDGDDDQHPHPHPHHHHHHQFATGIPCSDALTGNIITPMFIGK